MTRIVAFALVFSFAGTLPLDAQTSPLTGVDLRVPSITDSGTYFIYSYVATNWATSHGGVAIVSIDVSAPAGTGFPILPATGRFWHGAGFPGVKLAEFRDHVPVGPISPPNWMAVLTKGGTLDWFGDRGGAAGELDSIAPGDSLNGFELRSPYLPGVRIFTTSPTFASCCSRLIPATATREAEYPDPDEFRITGWTVAPAVRPAEMSLSILRGDLQQACGPARWITDPGICATLDAHLSHSGELQPFLEALEAHQRGGHINGNAYWLLKVNAEYLLGRAK